MGLHLEREDYLFGGYLVTQRVARPELMSAELLPARLLTASSCLAPFVPDVWALDWTLVTREERERTAGALGIAPGAVPALIEHTTRAFHEGQLGWPNIVKSSEALVRLMRLLPTTSAWVAVGLGLHRKHLGEFLEGNAPAENHGAGGVYEMILAESALPPGGAILGYEPLGFEYGGEPHSWLCNGLEKVCSRALGIRPGPSGLLETEDEAERAVAHISRDDVGAEPVRWLPWMLVDSTSEAKA